MLSKRSAPIFFSKYIAASSALPGVEQASISGNDTLPMNSGRNYSQFSILGRPSESEHSPVADIAVVDANYFPHDGSSCNFGTQFHSLLTRTKHSRLR